MLPIQIRLDLSFEGFNGVIGNKVPDVYVSQYQLIGTTTNLTYLDSSVQTGKRYMYYVVGVNATAAVSPPSNLVTFPLLLPSVTFARLLDEVSTLAQRQRFSASDT